MPDPTLTPDAPDFKSANLFEAVDAIRKECPNHLDWEEYDHYENEAIAKETHNRRAKSKLKETIEGMTEENGFRSILLNLLINIEL